MILTCELCQSQFLTESDPHVIIPGLETKIYCYCQVKGDGDQKWIDQLKHEHKLYQKHLDGLRAENDRLEAEIDDLKLEYDKLTDWASEYVAENAKLNQEIIKFEGYLEAWGKDE